jgi:hypothetical protein
MGSSRLFPLAGARLKFHKIEILILCCDGWARLFRWISLHCSKCDCLSKAMAANVGGHCAINEPQKS